jgi:hypothetical protein
VDIGSVRILAEVFAEFAADVGALVTDGSI